MSDVLIVSPLAREIAASIDGIPAGIEVATAGSANEIDIDLARVRALVAFPQAVSPALLARMPMLEWLQTLTAGVDPLAGLDLGGIALSSMAGVQGPQMAELAFLYMLAFTRDLRGILARQAAARWLPAPQPLLAGAHVVIVGVGRIAEALARRCQAFEMRVTGVSGSRSAAPGFDRIAPLRDLAAVAASADFLVVLAPYSPATHHLVSRAVIAALPSTAVLINIARGAVVDQDALVEALAEARIGGAGLDVFAEEPLPPDHALWRLPNVILTPHIGGWSTRFVEQVTPVIAENIRRWFGAPRRALVNRIVAR